MRCMKTMITCCSTMISPAQAATRPSALAKPSSAITPPQRKALRQMPMAVSTSTVVNTTKKNSTEPP